MDAYIRDNERRIEFEETAKKFEKFFNCEVIGYDPSYLFHFLDENRYYEIPRWFVEIFNHHIREYFNEDNPCLCCEEGGCKPGCGCRQYEEEK